MRRLTTLTTLVVALGLAFAAACADSHSSTPQCTDGVDNDSDGKIDGDDPACQAGHDLESQDPPAACANGIDDDGDGKTDFPDDPGCDSPNDTDEYNVALADCMNGVDDDGDGKIDYPNDPGCRAPNQMGENDDCPSGPGCPECGNGVDDDFDGNTDYPADTGCTSASGATEFKLEADACGAGTSVLQLPMSGMATGTISTGPSNVTSATCGHPAGTGSEAAYAFVVDHPVTLVATTDFGTTTLDTVLYVRRSCRMTATELACNDDVTPSNNRSAITVDLQPGAYYLVVDAKTAGQTGMFQLRTTFYNGVGTACATANQCAPTYTCRIAAGATMMTCEKPVCSDGRDDDGDTKIDFPNDPGCTAPDDATETDDCPAGPNCPDCGDGVDNDLDGQTDYPNDLACTSASGAVEYACTSADPVTLFTTNLTNRSMATSMNDVALSCGGANGKDDIWILQVNRPLNDLTIDTIGSTIDTAIALRGGSCNSFDLQCDDNTAGNGDSRIFLIDINVGEYYLVVDDKGTAGTYNLNVRGTIAPGGSCQPSSTAFVCSTGYLCGGTAGAETCVPTQCNDGVDNDADSRMDYPGDPGCTDVSDNTEIDTCPAGPGCPQCADTVDNDSDGFVDFPMDPGCTAASSNSELAPCTSADPVPIVTMGTMTGNTNGHLNDVLPSCGTNGRDDIYRVIVNRPLVRLVADSIGSTTDVEIAIRTGTCNGSDLVCDDNGGGGTAARAALANVGIGEYFIVVDDKITNGNAPYTLHVHAELAAGATCNPASTLYVCTTGYACQGAAGAETCTLAACNDGMDNDGDLKTDYPNDPGCADPSDNTETDTCPAGPGCPQCADGIDNDGDTLIDYPNDPGCTAASAASELAPCSSSDPVLLFAGNLTNGDTAGHADDFVPSCTISGRDDVYRLLVPSALTDLRIDTIGSASDTVLMLRNGTCNGTDLACDDDGAGNLDSLITRTNVTPGEYFIIVDDRGGSSTTYNLNVAGTIAIGGRCNPATTYLSCAAGSACGGTAGAEICQPALCNDGLDNDGDTKIDYPNDPGCTSPSDNDETDTCPGAGCPVCSNGMDDDGDTLVDFPADFGCTSAAGTTEVACSIESDPVGVITMPTTSGDLTGTVNNFDPACQTFDNVDRAYILPLPVGLSTLTMDTEGSAGLTDSILIFMDAQCGTQIACDDDSGTGFLSSITRTSVAAGAYAIIVDSYGTANPGGTFNLNVHGTAVTGAACTSPLFTSGVLACPAGTTCSGGTCH